MVSREVLAAAVDGVNRSGGVSDYKPFGPPVITSLRPAPPSVKSDPALAPTVIINVSINIDTINVIGGG
jgi:hypothetical protein